MYLQALLLLLLPPLSDAVSKPRLRGIFVDLTPTTMGWTAAEWTTDLRSMATAGIEFLVVHHSAVGDANISTTCPAGTYEAYFELNDTDCIRGSGATLAAVLQAAKVVGLRVHLGLAEQEKLGPVVDGVRRNPLYGRYANATAVAQFQEVQATLARGLWGQFGSTGVVAGFYTVLEEPQNFASSLPDWERLALHYFQPLAHYIKHSLEPIGRYDPGKLLVWSSPDAVGNYSRYHRAYMLGPRLYGDLWEQMFLFAPEFDHIALQDSQGERGQNSLADTAAFLGNCSAAGLRQNRSIWSNVELFQAWPPSCEWSKASGHCRGRAPAPMDRIVTQLATASAVLDSAGATQEAILIAWEWTTCLSPNGGSGKANISKLAADNYRAYLNYIHTPASSDASHAPVAATSMRTVPPCVASDWASLSSCIARLASGAIRFIEMTQIIDVPLSSAAVAISTSGATLYSTTGGGLRRKQVDLSHGGIINVQSCENVTLIGLTFIDELSTRERVLSAYKHCNPPNATGGGAQLSLSNAKYTTVTGCTFLNSSSFNVAVARSNFTLFRDNILSGCCLFGLWSPFYSTQTHMYMLNNHISDINSNAFLISIVDSLIQGNTISRTHSATVFGHDSGGQGALNNGSARVIISGNLIVNGSVTAGDVAQKTHGFEFSNGPSGVIDVLVQGNAMYNNTGFGVVADGAIGAGISGVQIKDNRLCAADEMWAPGGWFCAYCHPIGPPGAWVTADVGNCCDCAEKLRPHGSIQVSAHTCFTHECEVDVSWIASGVISPARVCVEEPWTTPPMPTAAEADIGRTFGRCWNSSLTGSQGSAKLTVNSTIALELWVEELAWPLDVVQVVVN